MCQVCQPRESQRTLECNCGCCGTFFRRFISAKEEAECLEEYREQLKKELVAVEERIQEPKRK